MRLSKEPPFTVSFVSTSVLVLTNMQHGQEILDSLAQIKVSLMQHYEQWRVNPSSAQFQSAPAHVSNMPPQQLVAHRSIQSQGASTPSSSTPSSSRSRASMPPRSRTPSPYRQSPNEEDRAWRERSDAMQRDEARRREEPSYANGARSEQSRFAREDDVRRRREREEEERRRITEQRQHEQNGILRRQQESEFAAQAAKFGQSNGQNQSVTMPQPGSVQYPSASGPAPASTRPIASRLQMPLESPTRYVIHQLKHSLPRMFLLLKSSTTDPMVKNLTDREFLFLA